MIKSLKMLSTNNLIFHLLKLSLFKHIPLYGSIISRWYIAEELQSGCECECSACKFPRYLCVPKAISWTVHTIHFSTWLKTQERPLSALTYTENSLKIDVFIFEKPECKSKFKKYWNRAQKTCSVQAQCKSLQVNKNLSPSHSTITTAKLIKLNPTKHNGPAHTKPCCLKLLCACY